MTREWAASSNPFERQAGVVERLVSNNWTLDFCHVLGWQGGTVHQVADELIKRNLDLMPLHEAFEKLQPTGQK